jgi:phospholipid/cholesterol/gamma-HCH transport system ATP-binding protein
VTRVEESKPVIRLVGVEKRLGGQPVLKGVNLEIPRGKVTTVIGKSGGGKSVLLKHMIGLLRPDHGQVLVDETDITRLSDHDLNEVRKKFAMLFQGAALFDSLTVFENVAFAMRVTGAPERAVKRKTFEVLAQTGLSHKCSYFPHQLSGGEQQMLAIGRALVLNPKLLLLDEDRKSVV